MLIQDFTASVSCSGHLCPSLVLALENDIARTLWEEGLWPLRFSSPGYVSRSRVDAWRVAVCLNFHHQMVSLVLTARLRPQGLIPSGRQSQTSCAGRATG
jgi:hypothetical protein